MTGNQGEVFRDADHVVPAGTTVDVATPGLTYSPYSVEVLVGKKRVLTDTIVVRCVPVGDYKNPAAGSVEDCDGNIRYLFSNYPITGAEGDVLSVRFQVSVRMHGVTTVHNFKLPDKDAHPYERSFTFARADRPRVDYTVDGHQLLVGSSGIIDCASDQPAVPNTGA